MMRLRMSGLLPGLAIIAMAACNESRSPATASTATAPETTTYEAAATMAPPVTATAAPAPVVKFAITSPQSFSSVPTQQVELSGVGADPAATLAVDVYTDDWYPQNGTGSINADGTWAYSGCWLKGQGEYRKHTIRVTQMKNHVRVASATVQGVEVVPKKKS